MDKKKTLSEAARLMGEVKSVVKADKARENGKLGGRPLKDLALISCNCGGEGLNHKSTCPRGRTIRQRQKRENKGTISEQ